MSTEQDIASWGAAVAGAVAEARVGADVAAWVRACAGVTPSPGVVVDGDPTARVDEVLDAAWRSAPEAVRVGLGQVFTPRATARQLLHETGFFDDPREGHLVDPACGGGIFLMEAATARIRVLREERST